jgi:hypothetical protein
VEAEVKPSRLAAGGWRLAILGFDDSLIRFVDSWIRGFVDSRLEDS